MALLLCLPGDLLVLGSAYHEQNWWITIAVLLGFAAVAVGLFQSSRWGHTVEVSADRIRLFRKERVTFEIPFSALEMLELNWSALVLVWKSGARKRTIQVPANEFAPETWTALTQSLRSQFGPLLRDTRRTLQ